MRLYLLLLIGVLGCSMLASCGEDAPPSTAANRGGTLQGAVTQAPAPASAAQTGATPGTVRSAAAESRLPVATAAQAQPAARQSDALPPPKDAEWTLYCASFNGPSHIQKAKAAKERLLAATPMKEWYLVHGDEETSLYYGYYRSISNKSDPAESARAQKDKRAVEMMKDANGQRLFPTSLFIELASPEPVAPPEWDLANVSKRFAFDDPNRPFWSLQVGAYKDHPDRKRYAVEAVKAARAAGEEAYFYHGDTVSSVCIGAWPNSVVEADANHAETRDPNQPIMVIDGNLPRPRGEVRDPNGRPVKVFSPQLDVIDPKVRSKMQQYPYHLTNGEETIYKDGRNQSRQHSFLVKIPHPDDSGQSGQAVATQEQQPRRDDRPADPWGMTRQASGSAADAARIPTERRQRPANSPPPAQPGSGRLRSLDGR